MYLVRLFFFFFQNYTKFYLDQLVNHCCMIDSVFTVKTLHSCGPAPFVLFQELLVLCPGQSEFATAVGLVQTQADHPAGTHIFPLQL